MAPSPSRIHGRAPAPTTGWHWLAVVDPGQGAQWPLGWPVSSQEPHSYFRGDTTRCSHLYTPEPITFLVDAVRQYGADLTRKGLLSAYTLRAYYTPHEVVAALARDYPGWPWWRVVALWRLEGERFVDRFHKLPAIRL